MVGAGSGTWVVAAGWYVDMVKYICSSCGIVARRQGGPRADCCTSLRGVLLQGVLVIVFS
jgi:hypothetical protein